MGIFERFLTLWVGLGILAGVILGNLMPEVFKLLAAFEIAHVNLAVALLIWVMIYPMMVQIDFAAVRDAGRQPRGLRHLCPDVRGRLLASPVTPYCRTGQHDRHLKCL